ncbi:hypothetical protein B9Z55_024555 [Caenorhabditis nigoni]|uniref:Uncharacterized protein n=1 Tax=Caenorhabditis nigoni TaxID=1611254 RepID=A0A2G5SVD7_9PELO|nr:hypothetical protein B9Z55_024555 [Caenorhabditis nigoni]
MDELMKQLHKAVSTDNVDRNTIAKSVEMNPYRRTLHEVLLERKDLLRSRMNMVVMFDTEEPSTEIEEILAQFQNPTFPIEEVNTEKDEEWQPLEKKYLDGVNQIKEDMLSKQGQLEKDMEQSLTHGEKVLRSHRDFRPVDERDYCNIRQSISRHFDQAKVSLRGEAATKILVLRRDIEQQGRKRRNFDKNTTDTLQNWFHEHRQNPYPTDQEKAELAKQCNIKISQVNNWFGNQRIRSKQQALRCEEEEKKRLAAVAAEEARQKELEEQNVATEAAIAASTNLVNPGILNLPLVNPAMQAMMIPSVQPTVINNSSGELLLTGFLQQPNYFTVGEQMPITDNANGQQFYPTGFENFGLVQPIVEQPALLQPPVSQPPFSAMNYLG